MPRDYPNLSKKVKYKPGKARSPSPRSELRPFSLKKDGIISLFGISKDVATSTMTDFPCGKTYGERKTQKIS